MTLPKHCGWALAVALAWGAPGPVRAGFTITDLGLAGPGRATMATAIGDSGAMAGWASGPDGTVALESSGGALRAVDTSRLPGGTPGGWASPFSVASGVNAAGSVVGTYTDYADHGAQRSHAFATVNGQAVDFGNLAGTALAGAASRGVAIDSGGTVLATAYLGGTSTAFRSSQPGAVDAIALPTGGSNGVAVGMNADGTAVGNYTTAQGASRIFVSTAAGVTTDLLAGVTGPGFGLNLAASGIAGNGDVAGNGDFGGQSHAFLVTAGPSGGPARLVDIGTIGGFDASRALGLNASGQVVGEMDASGYGAHAFLFDESRGLFDLNSLLSAGDARRWTLTAATGINDKGQVVGQGIVDGQLHAFLLTPTGDSMFSPGVVPTPPSVVLAVAGLALLGGWSRLRRGRTAGRATA